MFTGIIDHCGVVAAIDSATQSLRFTIATAFSDLTLGESIAVDGVCLTVSDVQGSVFCCDISPETLARTSLSRCTKDSKVNIERALAVGGRMGGHYVTGHVDSTSVVSIRRQHTDYIELQFSGFSHAQAHYLIPKGSITINGVSLTINAVITMGVTTDVGVLLIPHTLAVTNLTDLVEGSVVNIEFDYYAKVIAHQLSLSQLLNEAQYV